MLKKRYFYDRLGSALTLFCASLVIVLTVSIIYFISSKGIATFISDGVSLREFLFSTQWWPDRPRAEGGPQLGALSMIIGSVLVSLFAVGISAPLGIVVAVFLVEIAPGWGQRVLQPAVELLAGIPSVVYGYIGLSLLVPFIRDNIGGGGFSLLAGFLVLSVMILPTIISVSADSIKALHIEWKHASLALGATRWQTIRMVLVPAARSGLITAVVLGLARAFGEALAVQMVIGNTRQIPTSILDPMMTLTSAITMDMGATIAGTPWNNALWSMGLILLLMSLFFIMLIRVVVRRGVAQ
ncbi:phosphate ABC transporter permease subunit PstC [Desulfoscipio geothermicus]|uniref:Phosphate transport system permease protein n=1 Tax=Desulfoscipio geothermicus DSM 3669 TaxID=1121426 RepID=A0A1I6E7T4_9FIRM|nr:phosphate ABC transporter permease subunit PstC [Desulfoscipio geothermicus]SFR13568.1 phosphate ABC transporter membrane protein 1, PhoT family (TC 3.A.1.7.1) [Desulfoscipio geothermicus DSM 3669]